MRLRKRWWLLTLVPAVVAIVGFGGDFLLHDYDPTRVIYKRMTAADRYVYEEIHPRFIAIDEAEIIQIRSTTDAARIRGALVDAIWGQHQPADETRYTRIGEVVGPEKGAARQVERLQISMDYDTQSTAWLYHSKSPNGRLVIYHHGFASRFTDNQWFIDRLLEEGYAVIAINLLGNAGNSAWASLPVGGAAHLHSELDEIDRPLRLHLDPAIAAIDLATGALGYDSVDMIGFSAGAFITTVAAAVDPRIRRSYPIAGVYPISLSEGRLAAARRWAEGFEPEWRYEGYNFYVPETTYAKVLLAGGAADDLRQARELLSRKCALYEACHNTVLLAQWLVLKAAVHAAEGVEKAASTTLERALELTRPGGIVRVFTDVGPSLIPLLQRLDLQGDTRTHAGRVLVSLRGRPRDGGSPRSQALHTDGFESLTGREFEVLNILAQRMTDHEIAARLHISPGTVRRHTQNIYGKLGVHGRREAVDRAIGLGLLTES